MGSRKEKIEAHIMDLWKGRKQSRFLIHSKPEGKTCRSVGNGLRLGLLGAALRTVRSLHPRLPLPAMLG